MRTPAFYLLSTNLAFCTIAPVPLGAATTTLATLQSQSFAQLALDDPARLRVTNVRLVDAQARHPRWSPDGRRLLYTKGTTILEGGNIWLFETTSGVKRLVLPATWVAWSPDGRKIVYVSSDRGQLGVYDMGNRRSTDLISSPGLVQRLSWVDDTVYVVTGMGAYRSFIRLSLETLRQTEPEGTAPEGQPTDIRKLADYNFADSSTEFGFNLYPTRNVEAGEKLDVLSTAILGGPLLQAWHGFWASRKDGSLAHLLVPEAAEAELSPTRSQIAFVRGDSLFLASLAVRPQSPDRTWRMSLGARDGVVPGDLVYIDEAAVNPLNNRVIGFQESMRKATALVRSVFVDASEIDLHELVRPVSQHDIAVLGPLWASITLSEQSGDDPPVEPLYRLLDPFMTSRALECIRDHRSELDNYWKGRTDDRPCSIWDAFEAAGRLKEPDYVPVVLREFEHVHIPSASSTLQPLWALVRFGSGARMANEHCAEWREQFPDYAPLLDLCRKAQGAN